jgi:hypothetical protein
MRRVTVSTAGPRLVAHLCGDCGYRVDQGEYRFIVDRLAEVER